MHCHAIKPKKKDTLLIFCITLLSLTIGAYHIAPLTGIILPFQIFSFAHAAWNILLTMWWGIAIGIVMIGIMSKIPREYFNTIMGRDNTFSGLLRAVFAGVVLDLCCHGILLVAAKLYERGTSLPQVIAFLVASPWNSLSLTLVLIALIGLKWTLAYIIGSVIIALLTGIILQKMIRSGALPANPNAVQITANPVSIIDGIKNIKFADLKLTDILKSGWKDGKMIIKWLLFGTIIAAAMHAFIPADTFSTWLGPTIMGLFITLIMATVIEICSEGSAPIAAQIVNGANAPGNGFTFLMAGVATDYTEILAIREFTGSWKIALALPLITVPQVVLLGHIMNLAATSG